MKIILFIGHHKVGSTSLQTYLARNYYQLLNDGILYPAVLPRSLKQDFKTWAARRLGAGPMPLRVREAHNLLSQQMIAELTSKPLPVWFQGAPSADFMVSRIQEQIKIHAPETMILCSEAFSNFASHGDVLVKKILELCAGHDVQILCTLRRPDQYLTSWHLQRLKFGASPKPLRSDGLESYLSGIHFNYEHMLKPWVQQFGASTVSVINYADTLEVGGSIPNFWRQSGLQEPVGMRPVPRANPSISTSACEIVRLANSVLPNSQRQSFWRWMVSRNEAFEGEKNSKVEMYGPVNRETLSSRFEAVHSYVSDIAGREMFFPDIGEMTDLKPVSDIEASRAILPKVRQQAQTDKLEPEILAFLEDVSLG